MTTLTLNADHYNSMVAELTAKFEEDWQNVISLNDLERFIERINACGLSDLSESFRQRFFDENNTWIANQKELEQSIEQFNFTKPF